MSTLASGVLGVVKAIVLTWHFLTNWLYRILSGSSQTVKNFRKVDFPCELPYERRTGASTNLRGAAAGRHRDDPGAGAGGEDGGHQAGDRAAGLTLVHP